MLETANLKQCIENQDGLYVTLTFKLDFIFIKGLVMIIPHLMTNNYFIHVKLIL